MSVMSRLYYDWCQQHPDEDRYPTLEEQRDLMQKALEEQQQQEEESDEDSAAG